MFMKTSTLRLVPPIQRRPVFHQTFSNSWVVGTLVDSSNPTSNELDRIFDRDVF